MGAHSQPPRRPPVLALIGVCAGLFTALIVTAAMASRSLIASMVVLVLTFVTTGSLWGLRRDTGSYWQRYQSRWLVTALLAGLSIAYASVSSDGAAEGSLRAANAGIGFVIGALFIGSLLNVVVAVFRFRKPRRT